MVTTSLGRARVWASVGQGIPTEVYWPTPSDITTRDLGFVIADGSGWWVEVKAQASYRLQWPDAESRWLQSCTPGRRIIPTGSSFELVPDPTGTCCSCATGSPA